MALSSLSGSRCALWPALLQTSWPKPAWFGSPAPAAAKSGNEVNERVVLGHFPLISTQLKSSWGCDLRHRTFQPPPLGSRTQGRRCTCWGLQGGSAGVPGWGQKQLPSSYRNTEHRGACGRGLAASPGGSGESGQALLGRERQGGLSSRAQELTWGTPRHPQHLCLGAPAHPPRRAASTGWSLGAAPGFLRSRGIGLSLGGQE